MDLLVTSLLSVVLATPSTVQSRPQPRPASRDPDCEAVVQRVLLLLPKQPVQVIVFDTNDTTDLLKSKYAHVEGFVLDGNPAVYLRKQSSTFQHALAGPGIWDYALAITVWHEMAHLDGADERHAQEKEEELWRQFVMAGRVDSRRGLAYLALLRKRRQQAGLGQLHVNVLSFRSPCNARATAPYSIVSVRIRMCGNSTNEPGPTRTASDRPWFRCGC